MTHHGHLSDSPFLVFSIFRLLFRAGVIVFASAHALGFRFAFGSVRNRSSLRSTVTVTVTVSVTGLRLTGAETETVADFPPALRLALFL